MTLLLMAAGRGSRYGKLKQFDGLGPKEEFLMEFSIYDALENGFNHIVVITQKDNVDFLKNYLSPKLPKDIKLDVLSQELTDLPEGTGFKGERSKPWGTGHAVWTARNVIKTPFAIINADDYYGKGAYRNASNFIKTKGNQDGYALVAYTLKDTLSEHGSVSRGVCKRDGNKLLSVVERTKIERVNGGLTDTDSGLLFNGDELVSMNFWVCNPSVFDHIENDLRIFLENEENIASGEVYIPFVIQKMLEQNEAAVDVIPSDSKWFGITYADDKEKAMQELKEMTDSGEYTTPLWPISK
jgi:UTP-glucose-1-phosphate uridylyltransferase